jgi:hypothetical protein
LSNSDLAYIQKGDWFPELSHLVKVTGPQDIDTNLDNRKFRDEGEKIDIFIHTALNPHTFVLETLGTFLEKKDLAILAATLQGFASIGRILKKSDLAPAYRRHLKDLKTHLTANLNLNHDADPSVQLFKLLCEQAESGKSDLISWSAVNTLQQLEYPESLRIDLLDKKPAEIEADILQKNISRLSNNDRLYGRDNPCQDREYIKFWVYGPTEILLSVCNGTYYFDVVQEVLRKSGMRGIRLALRGGNATAVREAVNFAGEIFNQFAANSQDKRYIDNKTRKKLVSLLLPYINHSDIELRNLVAEKLNDGSNGHEVSNNLLDSRNRAKVAIIDTTSSKKWQRVVALGDLSIPFLCEAIEGKLKFVVDENQNTNCQVEALKSIDKIINDIPIKVNTLFPYLSHSKDKIKLETFHLLKNYCTYLDDQSFKLLIQIALRILDWNLVISFGNRSIPFLCQILAGKPRLKPDEASNVNCQIEALKSIDKIIKEIPDKVARLSRYLQHDNDALRIKVANLLQPQKEYLDTNSKKIFTALLFDKVNLPKETEESENFENCLQKAKREELRIEEIFTKAIDACADSSVSTKAYLNKQKECLVNQIKEYSNSLELKLNCQKIDNLNKKINLSINIFNILISIATFSLGLLISQGRSNLFVIPTEFDSNSSYYYIYILLQLGILDIFLGLLFLLLWGFTYLINPTSDSFLLIPTSSCVIIGVFIILTLFIIFNLIGIIFTALSSIPGESFGFLLFVFILLILLNFYNEKPGCLLFVFIGVLIGIVWTGYKIMGKIFESLSSIPWKILFGISSSFSFFYLTFTILFIIFGFLLLRLESKAYVLQKEIENLENLAKNNLQ